MRTDSRVPALIGALLTAVALTGTTAAGAAYPAVGNDIGDRASLQRGAHNFMNYCSGCHSAQFVRYATMAQDLGISNAELTGELMLTSTNPGDTIISAMSPAAGEQAFGVVPPDLSLIARARGTRYLYAFLRSYYADPTRATGVNNTVLPGTAMPHVLASLQGVQQAVFTRRTGPAGAEVMDLEKLELPQPGSMSPQQYDAFVRDTVNFLQYIGEPVEAQRRKLGIWVLGFLAVFTVLAYLLKREYWKAVR
jgi:ubiquinol-cytochrome c reductase cytochrome c1 subunit